MVPLLQILMLKMSPNRLDRVCERLPVAVLVLWSLRDAVCWSGQQPEETTRQSSCWLCRVGNFHYGIHRPVGLATIAVELGLGLRDRETYDGLVSHSPRPRACALRQELALGIRD